MISSRQRGTAREAIAKFSNIAKEAENSTKSFGSRSVTTLRGSATDAIHKFNKTATTNDEKINNNDTTNSRELNSVRRRGGARDTIERFNRVAEINKEKLDKLVCSSYRVLFIIVSRKKWSAIVLESQCK
uniref:Uncharacterized protein n=1 Tax=Parascaris equorum TaxID=6256 RepID=A0A914RD91_PAREQ